MQEPSRPHDPRLIRVIHRIYIERLYSVRQRPGTVDVRLGVSQQLFYELFVEHRSSWFKFLREWAGRVGCLFHIVIGDDARPEWWITWDEDECEDYEQIPWYSESNYIDDVFAVLDSVMDHTCRMTSAKNAGGMTYT